jgi:prephenate dehydrogenase
LSKIAIVGLGLMGASLAMAIREARADADLVGIDADRRTLAKARDEQLVDEATHELAAARGADVIFVAVPLAAMKDLFERLEPYATGAVVSDLGSTKVTVMEWAREAGLHLVGGHPMCGREESGIDAADPELYKGAAWVITHSDPMLEELINAVGAIPVVLEPERHDRLVAGVSHVAFMLSVGYVLALAEAKEWPQMGRLAGGGYRDMSRLAAGDPDMYAAIARTNRGNVAKALDAVIASLTRLRRHLDADDPRLVELFEEARNVRERWKKERDAGER